MNLFKFKKNKIEVYSFDMKDFSYQIDSKLPFDLVKNPSLETIGCVVFTNYYFFNLLSKKEYHTVFLKSQYNYELKKSETFKYALGKTDEESYYIVKIFNEHFVKNKIIPWEDKDLSEKDIKIKKVLL